jgi:hypothetical protein
MTKPRRLEGLNELKAMFEVRYHGALEALAEGAWGLVLYEDTDPHSPLHGDRVVVRVHQETGFKSVDDALDRVLLEGTGNDKFPVSVKRPVAYLVIDE